MPTATLKTLFNLMALGVALALAFSMSADARIDDTQWRHLAQGRLIAEQGEIPKSDPFNFSLPAGAGFDSNGWLFSLATYGLRQFAGDRALSVVRTLLLLGCFGFLVAAGFRRQARPFSCALFSLGALYAILPSASFSPALAGLFFFSAALFIMEGEFWSAFFGRWIWLPLLLVLWINLHATAILLPVLALVWALSERKSPSALAPQFPLLAIVGTLGVLGACVFLHPALWRVLALANPGPLATPFEPAFFQASRPALALLSVAALALLGSTALPQGKPHAARDLILFFSLLLPALAWRTMLPYACLLAAPMAAARCDSIIDALPAPLARLRWLVKIATLGTALYFMPAMLAQPASARQAQAKPGPKETLQFFKDELLSGKVFNDNDWAGLLLWQLSPSLTVFSDGVRGAAADYVRALRAHEGWEKTIDRYGADFAWLKINSPLAKAMSRSRQWQPIDFDNASVLYARVSPGNALLIKTWAPRGLRPGDLDEPFDASRLPQVEADLESRRLKRPGSGILHYYQARLALEKGHETLARQWLEKGIKIDPSFAPLYRLLGELRLKGGDKAGAQSFFNSASLLEGL